MGDSTPGAYVDASDFDVDNVARYYPEINQANNARGYTSIFNPDYSSTTTTTETTEMTTTTSETTEPETETTPTTESETEPGDTPTPTPVDQTEPSSGQSSETSPVIDDFNSTIDSGVNIPSGSDVRLGPDGEIEIELGENRLVKVIGNIVLTLAAIAFVIDLLLIGWTVYWRRQFAKKNPNEKAVTGYHYFSFMSRLFKYALPRKARIIAEKAAFAKDGLTPQEAEALITVCYKDMSEIAKGFNRFKKLLYNALEVKVTSKRSSLSEALRKTVKRHSNNQQV